jgi:Ser/Thr protein kinase RdoA (MazF antagonist)
MGHAWRARLVAVELTERVVVLLDAAAIEELGGGHQSRTFRVVRRDGAVVIAKMLDAAMVDRRELDARLDATNALADLDPRVCRPLPVGRQLVTEVTLADGEQRYVVCFEFADGTALDPSDRVDAERMGRTLAQLHVSMRQLPQTPLPPVAALRPGSPGAAAATGRHQLLHCDFNAGNLRDVNGIIKVFDLDDCGYGPPAFDVANALYMVLFDSVVHTTVESYETFRTSFVSGYVDSSRQPLADDALDRLIDLRVDALRRWIADLDTAPVGIRTASHDWLETLRSFAATHRPMPS